MFGRRHGGGSLSNADGSKWEGRWEDGVFVEGKIVRTDGSTQEGQWVNEKLMKGVISSEKGVISEGTFTADGVLLNGLQQFVCNEGTVRQIVYVDGVEISRVDIPLEVANKFFSPLVSAASLVMNTKAVKEYQSVREKRQAKLDRQKVLQEQTAEAESIAESIPEPVAATIATGPTAENTLPSVTVVSEAATPAAEVIPSVSSVPLTPEAVTKYNKVRAERLAKMMKQRQLLAQEEEPPAAVVRELTPEVLLEAQPDVKITQESATTATATIISSSLPITSKSSNKPNKPSEPSTPRVESVPPKVPSTAEAVTKYNTLRAQRLVKLERQQALIQEAAAAAIAKAELEPAVAGVTEVQVATSLEVDSTSAPTIRPTDVNSIEPEDNPLPEVSSEVAAATLVPAAPLISAADQKYNALRAERLAKIERQQLRAQETSEQPIS
eukprot:gene16976-19346_t